MDKRAGFLVSAVVALAATACVTASAESLPPEVVNKASEWLRATMPRCMSIGVPKVTTIEVDRDSKTLAVNCNWAYSNVPFTAHDIEQLKQRVLALAGSGYAGYAVTVATMWQTICLNTTSATPDIMHHSCWLTMPRGVIRRDSTAIS